MGKVRIIGGKWRGRRIAFPQCPGLRPTPDRVRETLFNWLVGTLAGCKVLDLFAGSGALGFEALSRGAAHLTLVDSDSRVVGGLRTTAAELDAPATIHRANALHWLHRRVPEPFDLVFVDPPYDGFELAPIANALAQGWLASGARVYFEHRAKQGLDPPYAPGSNSQSGVSPSQSSRWRMLRCETAGEVRYHLVAWALDPSE